MVITILIVFALAYLIAIETILLERLLPRSSVPAVKEEPVEMQEIEPVQSVINSINDFFLDKEV